MVGNLFYGELYFTAYPVSYYNTINYKTQFCSKSLCKNLTTKIITFILCLKENYHGAFGTK